MHAIRMLCDVHQIQFAEVLSRISQDPACYHAEHSVAKRCPIANSLQAVVAYVNGIGAH